MQFYEVLESAIDDDTDHDVDGLLAFFSPWLTYHDVDDPLLATCVLWADGTADVWAPKGSPGVILYEVAHALKMRKGE